MRSEYPVLAPVSEGYPKVKGRLLTCYSPVRRSSTPKGLSARLACVKHAASVRPEPGSNSPTKTWKTQNWQNKTKPKNFGTGYKSTLLSSQRTTTHPHSNHHQPGGDRSDGNSTNLPGRDLGVKSSSWTFSRGSAVPRHGYANRSSGSRRVEGSDRTGRSFRAMKRSAR